MTNGITGKDITDICLFPSWDAGIRRESVVQEFLVLRVISVASIDAKKDAKESQDCHCKLKRRGKSEKWGSFQVFRTFKRM